MIILMFYLITRLISSINFRFFNFAFKELLTSNKSDSSDSLQVWSPILVLGTSIFSEMLKIWISHNGLTNKNYYKSLKLSEMALKELSTNELAFSSDEDVIITERIENILSEMKDNKLNQHILTEDQLKAMFNSPSIVSIQLKLSYLMLHKLCIIFYKIRKC